MSDSNSTAPDIALDLKKNTATLPSPGEVLRLNREDSGLSLADVAGELNVTVSKVKYLEADEFQKMHSEPFTRGYLRSYAKLLKIDTESLIRCYEEYIGAAQASAPDTESVKQAEPGKSGSGLPVGKILPVALLLLASAWFVTESLKNDEDGDARAQHEFDSQDTVELIDNAADERETTDEYSDETEVELSEPAESAELNSTEDSEPVVIEVAEVIERSLDQLDFTFTDESWVEVTDSANDVLFADVKQAGDTLHLEGVAPFNVMLGNARATAVTLNGKAVDSNPLSGRNTLKFTVSSD